MATDDALTLILVTVVAPALVWVLGRTGWTGDRKRLAVLVTALGVGVVQAILTGVIAVPDGWADVLGRFLVSAAGTVALTQAVYQLLVGKLPDSQPDRIPKRPWKIG